MNKEEFQALLDGINARSDIADAVKEVCLEAIRQAALEQGISGVEHGERVSFALHLLDMREPRPVISERLKARFGIGKSQAYRDIEEALNLSQKRRINGTSPLENEINEEATN